MTNNENINNNSYAHNVNELVRASNAIIGTLEALNESVVTNKDYVNIDVSNEENEEKKVFIPSYQKVLNELQATKNIVETFISGQGIIKTQDGTERFVQVTPIPEAPKPIYVSQIPTTFSVNNNWFFEDLMFPRLQVMFDLKGQVDNDSDRVKVSRIILDASNAQSQIFFNNYKARNSSYNYKELKEELKKNDISYNEDIQEVTFPLTQEQYSGSFSVIDTRIIDGKLWFYLDKLVYGILNEDGEIVNNKVLKGSINESKGDILKYQNTLYRVDQVIEADNRVTLTPYMGNEEPSFESVLTFYNEPFKKKEIGVNIGHNELDFIFFKAINENFNLLSSTWSNAIPISTSELVFEGTNQSLNDFYYTYVSDFGKKWIAQTKDRKIFAYEGKTPNVPKLLSSYFSVVQINTQINSTLDRNDIKNTTADIETYKSSISSLRDTIALLKTDLQKTTDKEKYTQIQNQISINTTTLYNTESQYRSSLKYLQDLIKGTGLSNSKPKYRVRGFFPIPEEQYTLTNNNTVVLPQTIIGFDVRYRYLRLDETGTDLKTFSYNQDNIEHIGVFTDWCVYTPSILEKQWDENTKSFKWVSNVINNGSQININQIDIPIQRGEKVEIQIRSISEAGYPENPLKSDWSESVVVDFPEHLSTESEVELLIQDVLDAQTSLEIDTKLDTLGIPQHLNDQIQNTNSVNNLYYKHKADNLAYEYETKAKQVYTVPIDIVLDAVLRVLDSIQETEGIDEGKTKKDQVDDLIRKAGYFK